MTLVADLRAAIALLTRLPIGVPAGARAGAAFFPLVGLLVGVVAAVPVLIVGDGQPTLAAIGSIALAALVTGGLHLDGLADTADALMAPDPARAEAARRDPRVGSGGVIALILAIGAEAAAIAGVVSTRGAAVGATLVVLAMVVSRAVPVLAVALDRPSATAGPATGFGAWFAEQIRPLDAVVAVVLAGLGIAAAGVVLGSWWPVLVALTGAAIGGLATAAIRLARGRLDGDGFGASIELTVVAIVVTAAAVGG